MSKSNYEKYAMCQFLIGNVSRIDMKKFINCMTYACQFLIGNVYQLILSVSINDTTPFSAQNQYKMVKKSVDLKHHNISKSLILKGLAKCHYSPLPSTDFSAQNQVKYVNKSCFLTKLSPKTTFKPLYLLDF